MHAFVPEMTEWLWADNSKAISKKNHNAAPWFAPTRCRVCESNNNIRE
jgi:hypothetical protein